MKSMVPFVVVELRKSSMEHINYSSLETIHCSTYLAKASIIFNIIKPFTMEFSPFNPIVKLCLQGMELEAQNNLEKALQILFRRME
jgi:hypothetical protein